ncbi:DMT family transporter [Clostridium tyrobutyricum]|uniref:DMT family transporter n=1 Tax=Clostridium tyrobutyricum TaxID=1519 RepID=UPI00189C881F|nr:DMT family transporter [Clostridium tyrobutyricum]
MNSNKILGAIFLSISASIWGGMFVVVKVVVEYIPPVELVWLRYLIALFFLVIFGLIRGIKWRIARQDLFLIFLIGLIGNTISIVTQETGTWLSSAQLGAVITSATPTFMIIFAWLLLKERITSVKIISIIMATLGVIMIVGIHITGNHGLLGVLSLVVAALTWALMSVLIKKVSGKYDSLQITIYATFVAIVCLTPFVINNFSVFNNIHFTDSKIIFSLLYLGIVSTAVGFVMWNKGLQLMNAGSSGLFFLFQPIVGTLLSWLVLGEGISWGFFLGTVLILGSVWLTIRFVD